MNSRFKHTRTEVLLERALKGLCSERDELQCALEDLESEIEIFELTGTANTIDERAGVFYTKMLKRALDLTATLECIDTIIARQKKGDIKALARYFVALKQSGNEKLHPGYSLPHVFKELLIDKVPLTQAEIEKIAMLDQRINEIDKRLRDDDDLFRH